MDEQARLILCYSHYAITPIFLRCRSYGIVTGAETRHVVYLGPKPRGEAEHKFTSYHRTVTTHTQLRVICRMRQRQESLHVAIEKIRIASGCVPYGRNLPHRTNGFTSLKLRLFDFCRCRCRNATAAVPY